MYNIYTDKTFKVKNFEICPWLKSSLISGRRQRHNLISWWYIDKAPLSWGRNHVCTDRGHLRFFSRSPSTFEMPWSCQNCGAFSLAISQRIVLRAREWPSGWRVCCICMKAQVLILSSLGTFKEVGKILVYRSTAVYSGTLELLHMSRVHRCLHLVGPQWYDRSDCFKDLGHVNSTSASTETRS